MDMDDAFKVVGEFGPMQRRVFWSMAGPQMFIAWQHLQNIFVGAEPYFICVTNKDEVAVSSTNQCASLNDPPCLQYIYSINDFTSIVSEWNLICTNGYKADAVQSVLMVGLLFGNLIGGYYADHKGRRPVTYISMFGIFVFSCIAAFATQYQYYVILRFFAGLCCGAYGLVSFTLPAEIVGPTYRGYVNLVSSITFALGISTLSLLAFFVRDWRNLCLIASLPGLIAILYYFIVPESPRWLLTQGRVTEAEEMLIHISKSNEDKQSVQKIILKPLPIQCKESGESFFSTIVGHTRLLRMTLNNIFTWFVVNVVYYGLTIRMGDLAGNRYFNVAMSGLVEIPACYLTFLLMDKFGRRPTYSWSLIFGGFVSLCIMFLPTQTSSTATLIALVGKTFISITTCVCWMHCTEMYPTNIRNKALSICSMSGRLGGIVAPFILTLAREMRGIEFVIFGAFALISGVIALWLPETLNRPLPETIDDI